MCISASYPHLLSVALWLTSMHVKARITSYTMKYEQRYTLKFSIPSSLNIPVTYRTRCQQMCFGICRNVGFVNVTQMLQTLPNYCVEENMATFTQDAWYLVRGWIGEGSSVNKSEEPLQQ